MEEQIQDVPEVLETQETVEETTTPEEVATEETHEETLTPEQIADLKAKAAKAEELESKNKQLFERLKKQDKPENGDLSQKDVLALAKANLEDEDMDAVVDYARFKKIPVSDALKSSVVQTMLKDNAEMRRTASATQTKSGRGISKVSGTDLLARAERTGELPDTDEGMAALVQARIARKIGKKVTA